MDVVDGDDELLKKPPRLALPQPALAHDVLKHVAPRSVLHGNAEVPRGQEDFLVLHDVGVHELAVVYYLALHIFGDLREGGGGGGGFV